MTDLIMLLLQVLAVAGIMLAIVTVLVIILGLFAVIGALVRRKDQDQTVTRITTYRKRK